MGFWRTLSRRLTRWSRCASSRVNGTGSTLNRPFENVASRSWFRWQAWVLADSCSGLVAVAMADRCLDTIRFYGLLERLQERVGGPHVLADCHGRMNWPRRGVYFFYEAGERRSKAGTRPRIVRIGTHALKAGSRSTLWRRLSQHRGSICPVGGNHRGSIFRLLLGAALGGRGDVLLPRSWGVGQSRSAAARRLGLDPSSIKAGEAELEERVSRYIGGMPFVFLPVDDPPAGDSQRGFIERNAIALLSGYVQPTSDAPSPEWLGRHGNRERVRSSGLWNNNHVDETCDPVFLEMMEERVNRAEPL